ncbi:MAG: hypothetical protein PHC90_01210 [Syntrophorhabdaceae bacterium]|nr:hypothetical protein [Syntrophorhabdaceae bacterium]
MEWIEIIRLRTQPDVEPSVIKWLKDLVHGITGTPGLNDARIYTHSAVPGDVSLHIMWNTVQEIFTESEVGLMAAETLKKYGILDHTVWLMKELNGRSAHQQVLG